MAESAYLATLSTLAPLELQHLRTQLGRGTTHQEPLQPKARQTQIQTPNNFKDKTNYFTILDTMW